MSPTFLAILATTFVVVAFWRIAVQVLIALVLALLVFGIGQVAQALTGDRADLPDIVAPVPAPAVPELGPNLAVPDGVPDDGISPPR
jgi:hypothetical protein